MDTEDKRMRSVSSSFKTNDGESTRSVAKFNRTMTHKKIQPSVSISRSDSRSLQKKVTFSMKLTQSESINLMKKTHSGITQNPNCHINLKVTKKQQNPPISRSVSDSSCVRTQSKSDANRRIKKDERSKLPRPPGQKLQQRKKITKDQQSQLEHDFIFRNPDWTTTVGREEYRLANCPDIRRDQIVNFMKR
ncbi:Protein CBG27373 [Caenorhabditis briggsae]|uniref:Protein CBG27373 n=1 Tax=Caenorhabditis briggsae TaxID=6238 RepID=B6IGH3_CAEBR|nr:Protein CBG27373 [Caenorhabditis briggsae]CAR99003.1 Protein CBG27373 [Caenorhabditis briggsae]